MAGDWQWSPLGIPGPHSAITKSFPVGTPPGCLGQAVCFQRVGGGACRKHLFFRNLEAKFLKTENLRGAVREAEPKRDAAAGLRTGK